MTDPKDASQRLRRLMDALAENVMSASDTDILGESAAQGVDPAQEASRVRELLVGGILQVKKERLRQAHGDHGRAVEELGAQVSRLPPSAPARRALLMDVIRRRPQMQEAVVTLQHREFESFSDADVESALRQLAALGILDDGTADEP